MQLATLLDYLETLAPPAFQESYDNSGLLTGNRSMTVSSALVTLDCTEAVVDEAIQKGCNLIIAHHPIVFSGIKKLNGNTYVERVVIKAIKNDIAIYAIHTNLDHVWNGVNAKIAERLGLKNTQILAPKSGLLRKLVTFCPLAQAEHVRHALFDAGAGVIGNYDACSFNVSGTGTFRGNERTNPYVGEKGQLHKEAEERIEVVYPAHLERAILRALDEAHPYEEVAYDIYDLKNAWALVGAGMIGEWEEAVSEEEFLRRVKAGLKTSCIRYTPLAGKQVRRVALCGGAGSFLLPQALSAGADAFVTADFKYHEFFDAENRLIIADVGHYESEQFTKELIADALKQKFITFAVHLSEIHTNPISYFS
jgi:dinuclear metal center YbgI/SA1388 family protein